MSAVAVPERVAELEKFTLKYGGHKSVGDGVCVMAAAWAAAWDAARKFLAPIVARLQQSAVALLGRMIDLI